MSLPPSPPLTISSFGLLLASLAFALAVTPGPGGTAFAQESTEELIERLKGGAGKAGAGGGSAIRTRGIAPRSGVSADTPAVKSATRSVVMPSRGIPAAIQVAVEEEKLSVADAPAGGAYPVAAGEAAVEVSYAVDSDSEVSRDNIFFKRGSDEFADEASFEVVRQLADALKSPALAGLHYVVEGHASAEGGARLNQELSQRRAERIVSVLSSLGADRSRLVPIGFGASQAQFPANAEEFLRKRDRRVLVFRLDR